MSKALSHVRFLLFESRYRIAALYVGFYMTVWLLTRLGLLFVQSAVSQDGVVAALKAVGVGEIFDGVTALWLVAPLVLYLALVPERWFRGRVNRAFLYGGLAVATFTALFVAVVEYFFFEEFNGRFNFVAVDYLVYPT